MCVKYLGFKMKAATSVSFPLITVGVNQQALCKGQAGLQVCRLWYYVVKELQYTASTRLHTHTTETKELRVLEFFFFFILTPKRAHVWKGTNAKHEHVQTGEVETALQEKRVKSQGRDGYTEPLGEGLY